MAGIKKPLMLMVWRFQQVNSMIIIVGLSMTLTFQLYPYIGWRFAELGIPSKLDWLIMLIIFILIFAGAILIGFIYDVLFKLWIPSRIVQIERDPYQNEKIQPKMILNYRYTFLPLIKKSNCSSEAKFLEKWIERNLDEDENAKKVTKSVVDWVNDYELKPEDIKWLDEIERLQKKSYAPEVKDVVK